MADGANSYHLTLLTRARQALAATGPAAAVLVAQIDRELIRHYGTNMPRQFYGAAPMLIKKDGDRDNRIAVDWARDGEAILKLHLEEQVSDLSWDDVKE